MKAQVQLFARPYGGEEWVILDLYETEPIRMNLRVQDVTEPTIAVASYSQTFRVPHTYTNGKFFQQIFNVNQTLFDPSKKAQAYINNEGQLWMNGNLQLLNVFRNEASGMVEYEIIFMNETSDFATQIGIGQTDGGFLRDLDFSEYNHPKDYNTIRNSWNRLLFDGDVVYPLIEWGYTYEGSGSATFPAIPTISTDGVRTFTNSATPLGVGQLKPALRVKTIWDKIFSNTEYTYVSDFLNSPQFLDLYTVADSAARAEINVTIGMKYAGYDQYSDFGELSGNSQIYLFQRIFDFGANFNQALQKFVIPVDGNYTFKYNAKLQIGQPDLVPNGFVKFILKDGTGFGSTVYEQQGQPINNIPISDVNIETPQHYFNANQEVYFFLEVGGITQVAGLRLFDVTVETGVTPQNQVNPSSCLPDNIKQIDFIKSIVEKFKLVFEPLFENPKVFRIEPWDEWITQGIVRDWTSKLNGEKDYKLTPLFQTQERFVTYKDQEDSDYLNYNYQQAYKQTYGQLNLDSFIEVIKGTKDVAPMFAPLPIGPIGYGPTAASGDVVAAEKFLIPHVAKDEVTKDGPGRRTPIQPKLRLGYYYGLTGAPKPWYYTNTIPQTTYPLMSSYWPHPWDPLAESLDWSYAQPTWITGVDNPTYNSNPSGVAGGGYQFNNYWQRWYYSTYGNTEETQGNVPTENDLQLPRDKDYAYLFEGEFILDYRDLLGLRFNDKIFIKDAYYLINYINNYTPGQKSPCKVELYKLNNIGVSLPNTFLPVFNICYSPDTICSAVCCQLVSPITTVFSTDAEELVVDSVLFLNETGTILAPDGYYSDGTYVYTIDEGQGTITAVDVINASPALCECVPILESLELCYVSDEGTFCDACCCQGDTVTLWMESNGANWYENPFYFASEAGGTAPNGYYSATVSGIKRYVRITNGLPGSTDVCDSCNCDIYDLTYFIGCTGATECDASCCVSAQNFNWYGNAPLLADATFLYLDQALNPVANGWYSDGISTVRVTGGAGAVTEVADPEDCLPCENQTLDVYFDFQSAVNGTGTFTISKSFDGANWSTESVKSLSTIPALTTFNYTGAVSPSTFVRGTLTYGAAHTTGTFVTTIEQGNVPLNSQNTVRFSTYNFQPPLPSATGREYRFSVNLTGSSLDCGLSGGSAFKCIEPSCIIDETNSLYVVNNDLTACCDPLFVTNTGTAFVTQGATLFVDANCTGSPDPGVCYSCNDYLDGTYAGSDFYIYPNYDICDDLDTQSISFNWFSLDRPNRFNFYDNSGLLTTSAWVGSANYAGPWGFSLNTPSSGTITVPYTSGQNLRLQVEAGPADLSNPISDAWTGSIVCNTSCFVYYNNSGQEWTGDYQLCDGTWYYATSIAQGDSICARVGTVFTIYGADLPPVNQCNI